MSNTPWITNAILDDAAAIAKEAANKNILDKSLADNYSDYEDHPEPLQRFIADTFTTYRAQCVDDTAAASLDELEKDFQEPAAAAALLISIEALAETPDYKNKFPIFTNPDKKINSILQGNSVLLVAREEPAQAAADPNGTGTAATGSPEAAAQPDPADILLQKLIDIKPELNKDRYPWADIGFSRLFTDLFVNECRYNTKSKCWYFYDGKRWTPDPDGKRVESLAKDFYNVLVSYCASKYIDQHIKADYLKEVAKLGKFYPRNTIIKDAASNSYFSYEDLDRDKNLFNCQNGVFNLETMTFTPGHDPNQMLSKISNVNYDPTASSSEWEKFISEVMQDDTEKINYLQKVLGYCLTANTDQECLWFWYGEKSRNGKSTTAETLSYMMGNAEGYAAAVDPNTLSQKSDDDSGKPKPDLARLEGVRFLNVSEPPKNMLFNAALVKKLTGGNRLVVRDVYEKPHEYNPVYKIIIDTNYLPVVTDDTLFMSGRIIVITFDRVFSEAEQDHTLKDRLRTPQNISGLFNWCLEGLRKYRVEGLKKPVSIQEATEQYKNNSDKVNLFFAECMERLPGINTKGKDVYQHYKSWCYECGYSPEGQQNFFGALRKRNLLAVTGTVGGKTAKNVILDFAIKLP